jgi:hypothetical protein
MSKNVGLVIVVGVITGINLAALAGNLFSIAKASVAGMDYRELYRDRDFRRAVESIIEDCRVRDREKISC